jgi:hypothetical protein
MSQTSEASEYGLSRQTYKHRLIKWKKVIINGKPCLVNPRYYMELKEPLPEHVALSDNMGEKQKETAEKV